MTGTVPYLVGATLALAVGGMSTVVGFDRDRAFYPTWFACVPPDAA